MTPLPLLNSDGVTVGRAALAPKFAEQAIKQHLIHETVVAELAARRAGTHATRNRSAVRGGGAKPWRQKGTGRARQGSTRAPQWTGGGVVFGPSPRTYGGKVNRKIRQQAFRAALRAHADRGSLAIIEPLGWDAPSTKRAVEYLRQAPEGVNVRPLLVVVDDVLSVEARSFRNIEGVYILAAAELQVVDIVAARALLFARAAWERIAGEPAEVEAVTAAAEAGRREKAAPAPPPPLRPPTRAPRRPANELAARRHPPGDHPPGDLREELPARERPQPVHVPCAGRRAQDGDPSGHRGHVRRHGHRRPDGHGAEQAEAPRPDPRSPFRLEEGHRRAEARRQERDLRGGVGHGDQEVQAHVAGSRFVTGSDFDEITSTTPEKSLLGKVNKTGGRNNNGRITSRHIGGGHKRRYRIIDFKRQKDGVPAKVATIEYDPNRTARIALLHYADGEKRYILAPLRLRVGDTVMSGPTADIKPGNALPLRDIPTGTILHNIELQAGRGGQIVRSAGTGAQLMAKEGDYATVRLPSSEMRMVHLDCRATIGQIGNVEHENITIGKAGRSRWKGVRPRVRGSAMNPVDHPHGGGEGKSNSGRHPVTPWGVPTNGYRTRNKLKASSKYIVRGRKRGKHTEGR